MEIDYMEDILREFIENAQLKIFNLECNNSLPIAEFYFFPEDAELSILIKSESKLEKMALEEELSFVYIAPSKGTSVHIFSFERPISDKIDKWLSDDDKKMLSDDAKFFLENVNKYYIRLEDGELPESILKEIINFHKSEQTNNTYMKNRIFEIELQSLNHAMYLSPSVVNGDIIKVVGSDGHMAQSIDYIHAFFLNFPGYRVKRLENFGVILRKRKLAEIKDKSY